jgi:uncharacterized protein YraI
VIESVKLRWAVAVAASLVTSIAFPGRAESQEVEYRAYTTASLRLRDTPDTNGRILAVMPQGAAVRVIECERSWCSIVFRSSSGFAAESLLVRSRPVGIPLSTGRGYRNSRGIWMPSPTRTPDGQAPAGASAQCRDGTYSFSMSRRGTCSHHGGVARWL